MKDSLVAAAVRGIEFTATYKNATLVVLENDLYYNYDCYCYTRENRLLRLSNACVYISETGYVTLLTRDEDAARDLGCWWSCRDETEQRRNRGNRCGT